jgi:UDP-N-acetylmuramyl tripeptide synthase
MAPLIAGAGSVPGADVEVIVNRHDAVVALLDGVEPGDVALVLGRGALPRLLSDPGDPGRPFDDRQVVRDELRRRRALAQAAV